jgi:hypothetical protein
MAIHQDLVVVAEFLDNLSRQELQEMFHLQVHHKETTVVMEQFYIRLEEEAEEVARVK